MQAKQTNFQKLAKTLDRDSFYFIFFRQGQFLFILFNLTLFYSVH